MTTKYQKIFGAGPRGLLVSSILFGITYFFSKEFAFGEILESSQMRLAIFIGSIAVTIGIVVWSLKSLPPKFRGECLVKEGAFAWFRHPLYGAFLSFFNFALAIFLNDYIYIVWAILQHPVWHFNIRQEEKLMINKFGEEYLRYSEKVSRFFPIKYFIDFVN
jgi:protein-S-isoprenylcysteine O-methyltransferase Ste14